MAAQIDAHDEALQHAREAARVILAKHPAVTVGGASRTGEKDGLLGLRLDCDRILAAYERREVGRSQDAAGGVGSM